MGDSTPSSCSTTTSDPVQGEPYDATAAAGQFTPLSSTPEKPLVPIIVNVRSLWGLVDALLRAPERAARALEDVPFGVLRLVSVILLTALAIGVLIASFSGGVQYFVTPLKIATMALVVPVLCLPSLYIFSCMSSATTGIRTVTIGLGIGLAIQGVLLCGLAPVAWVFAQSTNSVTFMGGLYIVMYLVSSVLGFGVVERVLSERGQRVHGFWLWKLLFVIVFFQLATTLRPLVGPFVGIRLQGKLFFLSDWAHSLFS
jgi:hypothetical protein